MDIWLISAYSKNNDNAHGILDTETPTTNNIVK